mgnify:CR=1 FL=1
MHTTVNGTYYKKILAGALLYNTGSYTYLTYGSIFGVELYDKASFENGSKTSNGIVAITGAVSVRTIPSENGAAAKVLEQENTNISCVWEKNEERAVLLVVEPLLIILEISSDNIPVE